MVWLVRWEDLDQLEKPVWVDEKENVEVLDPWELQEGSDYQEDRDHEELWADVECQEAVESKESKVQWEPKDLVELAVLLVNWANQAVQEEMERLENQAEMEHQENQVPLERWDQQDVKDMLDLLEFQDTQDHPVLLVSEVMLVDQDFQAKTEDLDQLEHKDQLELQETTARMAKMVLQVPWEPQEKMVDLEREEMLVSQVLTDTPVTMVW